MRFRQWYNSLSLSMRTMLLAFCFVALPTLLLGIGSHAVAARILRSQALRQSVQENRERAMLLDNALRDAISNFNRLLGDRRFESIVRAGALGDESQIDNHDADYAEALLSNFRRAHGIISSATIYTEHTVLFERARHIHITAMDADYKEYFSRYQTYLADSSVAWGLRHLEHRHGAGLARPSLGILLAPYLEDVPSRSVVAVLAVEERVLLQYLADGYDRFRSGDDIRGYVLNDRNEVIAHEDIYARRQSYEPQILSGIPAGRRSGYISAGHGTDGFFVVYAAVSVNGWKLVTLIPADVFTVRTRFISYLTLSFVVLGTTLAALFSVLVSRSITRPLSALHAVVGSIRAGDRYVRFEGSSADEIGEFGHTMNRMLDETERLFRALELEKERVAFAHRLKHTAEMKALQAQMNPHFLYNSLNAVYWKCMIAGNREVAELCMSLSRFFRLGLSRGSDRVTVAHEIELVRTYLDIQSTVYRDRFKYSFDIAPEIESMSVPKFTLQPLVENSILHGFREHSGAGHIRVRGVLRDNRIHLTVEDNGSGFDTQTIETRLGSAAEWADEMSALNGGHALENIYRRIELFSGDDAGIEFSSIPNVRTTITIVIPVIVGTVSNVARVQGENDVEPHYRG